MWSVLKTWSAFKGHDIPLAIKIKSERLNLLQENEEVSIMGEIKQLQKELSMFDGTRRYHVETMGKKEKELVPKWR